MTDAAPSPSGLSRLGAPSFTCELTGGADAVSTQLVEVSVVAGSDLLLFSEAWGVDNVACRVVWGEPAFVGPPEEQSLLGLEWQPLAEFSGSISAWRASGRGELLLGGRPCDAAVLMSAPSALRVRVPPGAQRFVAECGFESGTLPGPSVRARCSVYSETR